MADAPRQLVRSSVPAEVSSTTGLAPSSFERAAGELSWSKSFGTVPSCSPASNAFRRRAACMNASARFPTGYTAWPPASAVTMQVVARKTSTTASACVSRYWAALSGRLSIANDGTGSGRRARRQLSRVSVGVEAAPVDLDPQHLFDAHVAEVDGVPEVGEEIELAALVGRLEDRPFHTEGVRERLRRVEIQAAGIVEEANRLRALARLHHDLLRARVEPGLAGGDQLLHDRGSKGAGVLVSQLHLHGQSEGTRQRHILSRRPPQLGESLARLDAVDIERGHELQERLQASAVLGDLEWTTAGHQRDAQAVGGGDLGPGRLLVGDQPARHGDLQAADQVVALLEMADERGHVVAGIE